MKRRNCSFRTISSFSSGIFIVSITFLPVSLLLKLLPANSFSLRQSKFRLLTFVTCPSTFGLDSYETTLTGYETTRTDYETTRTGYETARTDHETFRTDYETTRTDYETFRTDYETTWTDYETFRTDYETTRTDYETFRTGYETTRTGYETSGPTTELPDRLRNYHIRATTALLEVTKSQFKACTISSKFKPFPKQALVFTSLQNTSLVKNCGKRRDCLEKFLPFSSKLKLSSANYFSLEESKI